MNSRGLQDKQPTDNATDGNISERERIRGRMKMVIGQLEGILQELKDVAKELREVSTHQKESRWGVCPEMGEQS